MKFSNVIQALCWYADNAGCRDKNGNWHEGCLYAQPSQFAGQLKKIESSVSSEKMPRHEEGVQVVSCSGGQHVFENNDDVITKCDLDKFFSKLNKRELKVVHAFMTNGVRAGLNEQKNISYTGAAAKMFGKIKKRNRDKREAEWLWDKFFKTIGKFEKMLFDGDYLDVESQKDLAFFTG